MSAAVRAPGSDGEWEVCCRVTTSAASVEGSPVWGVFPVLLRLSTPGLPWYKRVCRVAGRPATSFHPAAHNFGGGVQ